MKKKKKQPEHFDIPCDIIDNPEKYSRTMVIGGKVVDIIPLVADENGVCRLATDDEAKEITA